MFPGITLTLKMRKKLFSTLIKGGSFVNFILLSIASG